MPPPSIFEAVGIHLLGPFAVTLLLFSIHRSFLSSYILRWTLAFAALSFFHLTIAAHILGPQTGVIPVVLCILGGSAAWLQLGWLIWGSIELTKKKAIKVGDGRRIIVILAAVGLVSGPLPYLVSRDPSIHRFFNAGLHALAAAAVFAICGIGLRRFRGPGFTVPGLTFVAYGGVQLFVFTLIMRSLITRTTAVPLYDVAVAQIIGCTLVGIGAILAVLENQRESAAEASSQVEHLAYYDTLTTLPNRALFNDRLGVALAHAHRHRYKLAVLFLDVDRFKQINDSLGHTVGDRLLKIVATRIRNTIREEDTVARFGGDEFTILLHIIGKIEDAGKVALKILDALKTPMTIDERDFVITCSVGISVYPVDGTDAETLIRNADTAMYRAKDIGRNTYQYYAATMNHKALEALEVENGLRRALAQNEFILYYQPLVDVRTGSVFGLEALIRWQHPDLGLLRPDRFIPAAEQSGLIIAIGRWVLREACKQAAEWQRRGHKILMAVNLSGRQFSDPDLINQVREALESAGLRPECLELEITEGYAMHDVEKAIQTLRALKVLGVRIAIDDFGTGYSCLSHLKNFPIDTLKLDRSFVRDLGTPEDAQIALGVIALAHSLKLKVIAEGVETISQLEFLRENSCDRLQGYLFSRPMPPGNFDRFMSQKEVLRYATDH